MSPLEGQNALFTGSFAAFKNAHVGCANCANVDSLPLAGTNSHPFVSIRTRHVFLSCLILIYMWHETQSLHINLHAFFFQLHFAGNANGKNPVRRKVAFLLTIVGIITCTSQFFLITVFAKAREFIVQRLLHANTFLAAYRDKTSFVPTTVLKSHFAPMKNLIRRGEQR